jgi:ParB family chromosome partitioning protein
MQQSPRPAEGAGVVNLAGLGRGGAAAVSPTAREPSQKDPDTAAFEKDLSDALGLRVEVRRGPGETGYLTIQYGNYEQLDHIRSRLVSR